MDMDTPHNTIEIPLAREPNVDKNKKISPSWRWDINPKGLSSEDIANAFRRTSDLFAYHGLPIAKQKLKASAKQKEVRTEMQKMLDEMGEDEWQRWVESLQKLNAGDRNMLVRVDLASVTHRRRTIASTSAPIDMQTRAAAAATARVDPLRNVVQSQAIRASTQQAQHIKKELHISLHDVEEPVSDAANLRADDVASTTRPSRKISTEWSDEISPVTRRPPTGAGPRHVQSHDEQVKVGTDLAT